ncbi:MAG: WYL domain-containing protein [Alphaproteobacteria bacterium]|nr:WYL domain-containing protein [Alphaproteobacteria bacterium]
MVQPQINYENEQGNKTQRIIKPLGIIYYIEVVLLAAWCDLRQDFRHFRIDRISAAKPTKKEFKHQAKALRQKWLEVQSL